jgi:DNA-binding SARP family transcriptional activator
MKFSLLGPVGVANDLGQPAVPRPLKLRELLALLLLNVNQTMVTDQLIDQLWDRRPPKTAKTTLQVYISRLRAHFGAHCGDRAAQELLVTEPSGYSLRLHDHEFDVEQFDSLCSRAEAEESAGNLECTSRLLKQALATWQGPALADVRGISKLAVSATRLDEARIAAHECHVSIELRLDRHRQTIAHLTELTARYPLRESLYGHLMLAQYRSGRTADSLDTYRRIRGVLVQELGLEPSTRLQLLHRSILNRDPALEVSPTSNLAS